MTDQTYLTEILERNVKCYVGANDAAKVAVEAGKLLIGTAISTKIRRPGAPLTSDRGYWEPFSVNSRRGVKPYVRATNVPKIAIWCGMGGDNNVFLQRRTDSRTHPLMPDNTPCDLGTFGWDYAKSEVCFRVHPAISTTVEALPKEAPIGAIDIVENQPDAEEHASETGNFLLYHEAITIGTIVVRAGDVREIPYSTQSFTDLYFPTRKE